jgi:exonuclease III
MKHKYKTRKLKKQHRINQRGRGIIEGIRVMPEEGLKIPYIKKCPEGFLMCDQDEVNSALCVKEESMCKDANYNFKYVPPDNNDRNNIRPANRLIREESGKGPNQDPEKPVQMFEIKYEGDYDSEDPNNPSNLLLEDVLINEDTGRLKSYAPEYHPTSCAVQQKNGRDEIIQRVYEEGEPYKRRIDGPEIRLHFTAVSSPFTILTQNALGLYRGVFKEPSEPGSSNEATYDLMRLRTALFRQFLKVDRPDFVCIQESTRTFIDLLDKQDMPDLYPYIYPTEEEMVLQEANGANATTSMLSKYPAKKATTYMLQGNSSYYNALGVYEFDNLVIVNVYMQAGSVISPGQKYKWENYARCRRQQLMFINDKIQEIRRSSSSSKAIVVLGDFNFELNSIKYEGEDTGRATRDENNHLIYDPLSSNMTWSEHKFLVGSGGLNLNDSYKELNIDNPGKIVKEGLTENTEINTFRFLGKLEEKTLRYDGIFFNDDLRPLKSEVVNNLATILDSDPDTIALFNSNGIPDYADNIEKYNREYARYMIFNPQGNNEAIAKKNAFLSAYTTNKGNSLSIENGFELFVSDHFGVLTEFEIKGPSGGKIKRKSRRRGKKHRKKMSKKSRL